MNFLVTPARGGAASQRGVALASQHRFSAVSGAQVVLSELPLPPVGATSPTDARGTGRGSSLELMNPRALDALRRIWLRSSAGPERQAQPTAPTALSPQTAPASS